ncbi:MAG: pitrilysin family protein [Gammaproteobacteria bacterium]
MQTKEYKLDNDLKLVVREDHRAPVVVTQVWYKVGAADELMGLTGISHALEHMMFQGSEKFPQDQFSHIVSINGGQDNAFTGADYTAYYEEMSADKLPLTFELEADRMRNLQIDPKAFQNEIQVVMEERRLRTDDKPRALAFERFMAAANPAGPYHHPIIGWMEDIEKMTVHDLRNWYEQHYCPNNATLVVVGAVNADETYQLAQKHFGNLPKCDVPKGYIRQELPPLGERRIKVAKPAKLPYLIMGFDVPSFMTQPNERESYALLLVNAVLDGGESARIPKNMLREQRVAASANAYYEVFKRYDTQFMLTAIPSQGRTVAELEQSFWAEIDKLKNEKLSDKELAKVKAQLIARQTFDKDSMSEQAISIGLLETIGASWQEMDKLHERVESLTADDIQAVVNKYFVAERMTTAELIPLPMDAAKADEEPVS